MIMAWCKENVPITAVVTSVESDNITNYHEGSHEYERGVKLIDLHLMVLILVKLS